MKLSRFIGMAALAALSAAEACSSDAGSTGTGSTGMGSTGGGTGSTGTGTGSTGTGAGPTCSDGVKNGSESDVDCGHDCPKRCLPDQGCNDASDCATSVCKANICAHA